MSELDALKEKLKKEMDEFLEELKVDYENKIKKIENEKIAEINSESADKLKNAMKPIISNCEKEIRIIKKNQKEEIIFRLLIIAASATMLGFTVAFSGALLPMACVFGVIPSLVTVGIINDVINNNKEIKNLQDVIDNAEKKKKGKFDVSENAIKKRNIFAEKIAKNKDAESNRLKNNKMVARVVPVLGVVGTVLAASSGLLVPALAAGGLSVALHQVVRSRGNAIEERLNDLDRKERKTKVGISAIEVKQKVIEEAEKKKASKIASLKRKQQEEIENKKNSIREQIENKEKELESAAKKAQQDQELRIKQEEERKNRELMNAVYRKLLGNNGELDAMFSQGNNDDHTNSLKNEEENKTRK